MRNAAFENRPWHHLGDVLSTANRFAHLRTAKRQQGCMNVDHSGRQSRFVHLTTGARINQQAVVRQNLLGMLPTVENQPIVRPHNERELDSRVRCSQGTQRSPSVRRARQVQFKIRHHHSRHIGSSQACHLQAFGIRRQLCTRFQGIERRNHQPYFFHRAALQEILRQCQMTAVHRIKRTAQKAYFPFHAKRLSASGNTTFGRYSRASSGVIPA